MGAWKDFFSVCLMNALCFSLVHSLSAFVEFCNLLQERNSTKCIFVKRIIWKHRSWKKNCDDVCCDTFVCAHSCELHPWGSRDPGGGERDGLLCVQQPQCQRQRGQMQSQPPWAASSQPVPPSQPMGEKQETLLLEEYSPGQYGNAGDLTFPLTPKNQVSQITVRPSEARMYDLLQCTEKWTNPYSLIYVQGERCCFKLYILLRHEKIQIKIFQKWMWNHQTQATEPWHCTTTDAQRAAHLLIHRFNALRSSITTDE